MKAKTLVLKINGPSTKARAKPRVVRVPAPPAARAALESAGQCLLCGAAAGNGNDARVTIGRLYARVCHDCSDGAFALLSAARWIKRMTNGGGGR